MQTKEIYLLSQTDFLSIGENAHPRYYMLMTYCLVAVTWAYCMKPRISNKEFRDERSWGSFFYVRYSYTKRSFSRHPKVVIRELYQ
ncbi:hypothetical protein CR513_23282, partial [Mucuna pruriens]